MIYLLNLTRALLLLVWIIPFWEAWITNETNLLLSYPKISRFPENLHFSWSRFSFLSLIFKSLLSIKHTHTLTLLPCVPEIATLICKNIEPIIFVASLALTEWLTTQKNKGTSTRLRLGHALLCASLCLPELILHFVWATIPGTHTISYFLSLTLSFSICLSPYFSPLLLLIIFSFPFLGFSLVSPLSIRLSSIL